MKDDNIDFFICHSQEEYPIAKGFKQIFDSLGISSYIAHTSLPEGKDWHLQIMDKLDDSKNMLILATENLNNKSQYCHFEIGYFEAKGLKKYIFFLDKIEFYPYIDFRNQGYIVTESDIESKLSRFFSGIGHSKVGKDLLDNLKKSIHDYLITLTRAKNVLGALKTEKEIDYLKVIKGLDDTEKNRVVTGILHELEFHNQSNLIDFYVKLFDNEKASGTRCFIIRETFNFLGGRDSEGLTNLLAQMCSVQYRADELDFIRDNHLDFFIDFFATKTPNFKGGTKLSRLLSSFNGRFEKNQLERLYVAMLCNEQINGQNFMCPTQSISTLKEIFQMQSKDIPEIIEDLEYIDKQVKENRNFSIINDEKIGKKIIAKYPDIIEKYQPWLIKFFNNL